MPCEKWIKNILALGPSPTRSEFEKEPALNLLASLYAEEYGADFLDGLERFVAEIPGIFVFSQMPSVGQLQAAIEYADITARLDDLHGLLRAYTFYWEIFRLVPREKLATFVGLVAKHLIPWASTTFCGGCGAISAATVTFCPHCASGTLTLSSYEVGPMVRKGLEYHVPSELYCALAMESVGFHLVNVKKSGVELRTSLTFNAFGVKVDVDAVGVGHPACVVFVCATTSKVNQGKAMAVKGTLDNLLKLMKGRHKDMPPAHIVLVGVGGVDSNLDLHGTERAGMTILKREEVCSLAEELAKIPHRLTA